MTAAPGVAPEDSFFAGPQQVDDWRKVLLYDAAAESGMLAALPASPPVIADQLGLDQRAVRILLDALAVWDVVVAGDDDSYGPGPAMPGADDEAVLRHHGRAIRNWSRVIDDRLRGEPAAPRGPQSAPSSARWLDALAVFARRWAPTLADACLAHFPDAGSALDLGGGHGEYALELARRGLRVTMQDRPEVTALAQADGRMADAGVQVFAGDFFEQLPDRSFDLVLLANVAHTYDAAHNTELYRRILPHIAAGGGLAMTAFVRGRDPRSAIFALQMLSGTGGGDAHTEHDYARWLDEAGFSNCEAMDLDDQPQSIVLAKP